MKMRALSIAWQVFLDLIALAVILGMIAAAKSNFQTIVISGLTLLYTAIRGYFALLGRAIEDSAQARASQFVELARLLNHPEIANLEGALRERAQKLEKTIVNFIIGSCFCLLFTGIAFWQLVNAIA